MTGTDKTLKFVVDASTIVAAILIDEIFSKPAGIVLDYYRRNKIEIIAPTLLSYEFTNAIRSSVLRRRVIQKDIVHLINAYKKLEIPLFVPSEQHIISIAINANLSIYDSAYLSLAISNNILLISADERLYNKLRSHNYINNILWIDNFKNIINDKLN